MLKTKPFIGLKAGKDSEGQTFFRFDASVQPVETKKRKPKRKPRFAFVLQAFNGNKWRVIRKDGMLITSKSNKHSRSKEFVKCLRDVGFVSQMKIQIYGKKSVSDKQFFSTPVRWRRIDSVSLV